MQHTQSTYSFNEKDAPIHPDTGATVVGTVTNISMSSQFFLKMVTAKPEHIKKSYT